MARDDAARHASPAEKVFERYVVLEGLSPADAKELVAPRPHRECCQLPSSSGRSELGLTWTRRCENSGSEGWRRGSESNSATPLTARKLLKPVCSQCSASARSTILSHKIPHGVRLFRPVLRAPMARDEIEPLTPAFSGLLTDSAKRFRISGSSWTATTLSTFRCYRAQFNFRGWAVRREVRYARREGNI